MKRGEPSGEPDARETLRQGLAILGVSLAGGGEALLERFLAELALWNVTYGFVKAEGRDLVIRHVLDSLSACEALAGLHPRGTVLDVGSGAGFPGIPLAIAFPETAFRLLERSAKRAAFLRNAVAVLALRNVSVEGADLREIRGETDVITFRAFSPLDRFFRDLGASGLGWRTVLAYKGRLAQALEETAALPERGGMEVQVREVRVPFLDAERTLVLLERRDSRGRSGRGPGA
jgi:16S rRNA (guanine527-N7)-methyltransferase